MQLARIRRHGARLGRFLRRPLADQWLCVQAFVLLGHSRYVIKRDGLKAVEPMLGQRLIESPRDISTAQEATVERIAWAISGVRFYTPWVSNCFPQALTACRLLTNHGLACTTYFGVSLDSPAGAQSNGFAAHAWTRCGENVLTGEDIAEQYRAIVWFGTLPDSLPG